MRCSCHPQCFCHTLTHLSCPSLASSLAHLSLFSLLMFLKRVSLHKPKQSSTHLVPLPPLLSSLVSPPYFPRVTHSCLEVHARSLLLESCMGKTLWSPTAGDWPL